MHLGRAPEFCRVETDIADGRRAVGWWLLSLAGMVFAMVILGGLTRLTGSGLSMVEWRPLNFLPPGSRAAWEAMFLKYQATPQFRLVNGTMTVADFKAIFWLEYLHRLWGRLMGVAFLLPFVVFLAKGRIGREDAPRLFALFLLGMLQGVIGWFMVFSGLEDRPEVSHYRLAAHLLAALLLFGVILWFGLGYLRRAAVRPLLPGTVRLRRALWGLLGLIGLTMTAGAFVAGLHAGLIYNSFPLMEGRLIPTEAFDLSPWWMNIFENLAMVQFDHRMLAITTWLCAVGLWGWSLRFDLPARAHRILVLIPAAATLQAALGITTLLLVVPIPVAAAHQAGAFLLFAVVLWALHAVTPAKA